MTEIVLEWEIAHHDRRVLADELLQVGGHILEVVLCELGHEDQPRSTELGRVLPLVEPLACLDALGGDGEDEAARLADLRAGHVAARARIGEVDGHGNIVRWRYPEGSVDLGGPMLNNPAARRVAAVVIEPSARALLRLRIPPDAVTVMGTLGTCAGAVAFFPRGQFLPGVLIICAFVLSDLLDGTMARLSGTAGPWGNFLDATLDRVADGAIVGSLVVWSATTQQWWVTASAVTVFVGGQVTSYAKARAEAVGASANVGIAERAERLIVLLGAALLAGFGVPYVLPAALLVLAVLSVVTVLQRIVHVRAQLRSAQ